MSDTYPKQRAFPASLDMRGREGGAASTEPSDPLAELARLVGRDDPFRDLFPAREEAPPARPQRANPPPMLPAPEPFERFGGVPGARDEDPHYLDDAGLPMRGENTRAEDEGSHDDDGVFHAPLGQSRRDSFRLPALPESEADDVGDLGHMPASKPGEAPPLNADLWAQGMPEPVSSDPLAYGPPVEETEEPAGSSTRRTVIVLAAVLALTAGGLGATFLMRGGSASTSSSQPPTILADSGPAKIQPPDTTNQATGGDGNTALIEKSASDNVNNAKVVNTQERPVDLSQLPKAPDPAPAPANDGRVAVSTTSGGGATASAFPEPRKVKTVLIRPDGSVVGEDAGQAAAAGAARPTMPGTANPADAVPKPATPKSTARAATTPKATTTPTDTAPAKPKPAHTAAKPKPAGEQTADAGTAPTDAAATPATAPAPTGSFAVQLAAPTSEQEAKDVSARLQKKFASELDGHAPTVRKADNKSVYRVRVGNLSQDDAKALCAKLQASGGSCFVVRN